MENNAKSGYSFRFRTFKNHDTIVPMLLVSTKKSRYEYMPDSFTSEYIKRLGEKKSSAWNNITETYPDARGKPTRNYIDTLHYNAKERKFYVTRTFMTPEKPTFRLEIVEARIPCRSKSYQKKEYEEETEEEPQPPESSGTPDDE